MSGAAVLAALLPAFLPVARAAPANDLLANRQVIPATLGMLSDSTAGSKVEPGEINESGDPAGARDQSIWYEWTPPETGVALIRVFTSPGPWCGLAVYSVADGDAPVTMGNLVPEAAVASPGQEGGRQVRLRATAGRRFILRVWTTPPGPVAEVNGGPITLFLSTTPGAPQMDGDLPATALPLTPEPGGRGWYAESLADGGNTFTAEAADHLIGGKRYPSGAARWYHWRADHASAGTPMRFSLQGYTTLNGWPQGTWTSLLVATLASPGGPLDLVAGPAPSLTFTPEAGREYLIRASGPAKTSGWPDSLQLTGAPAEPGDEPAAPRPLTLGVPTMVHFMGASPTRLSDRMESIGSGPDVWLELGGGTLSGRYRVMADRRLQTMVFLADAAGVPVAPLAGGFEMDPFFSQVDPVFLAEPGRRYLARVRARGSSWYFMLPAPVTLVPAEVPAPVNDRREGAVVLPADGPVAVHGDGTGASAEVAEINDPADPYDRAWAARPAVWYALDRPAGGQPWYAQALGGGTVTAVLREGTGGMESLSALSFPLNGARVWIKVDVSPDSRFLLLAGPAAMEGDTPESALALTSGGTRLLYSGRGLTRTQWLSWTAAETGPAVLSIRGSRDYTPAIAVRTAGGESVDTRTWKSSYYNPREFSFPAVKDTPYLISFTGSLTGVLRVCLRPGGWESPYELWLRNFPEREEDPVLTDPLADPDGDGVVNLMEMALNSDPLYADPPEFNEHPAFVNGGPQGGLTFDEHTWQLRGAEGSRPFALTLEGSANLRDWSPLSHTVEDRFDGDYKVHTWPWPPAPGGEGDGIRYYRVRVTR